MSAEDTIIGGILSDSLPMFTGRVCRWSAIAA
jgi:hypothetical protein